MMFDPTDPNFQPMSEESKSKGQLLSNNNDLRTENERLRLQLEKAESKIEFLKQYYNPADLSFKNMIDAFVTLPKDKQNKLIELAKTLKNLND